MWVSVLKLCVFIGHFSARIGCVGHVINTVILGFSLSFPRSIPVWSILMLPVARHYPTSAQCACHLCHQHQRLLHYVHYWEICSSRVLILFQTHTPKRNQKYDCLLSQTYSIYYGYCLIVGRNWEPVWMCHLCQTLFLLHKHYAVHFSYLQWQLCVASCSLNLYLPICSEQYL